MATSSEPDDGYLLPGDARWVNWTASDVPCLLCGDIYRSRETFDAHMRNKHRLGSSKGGASDHGVASLVDGVVGLWHDFMEEHQLPRVVPLFGDRMVNAGSSGLVARGSVMPMFYSDRFVDADGFRVPALVFPDAWLWLDVDAKCSALAHTAAHVENASGGIVDVSFSGPGWHNRAFMRTARTYDLYVSNAPGLGYARTFINDEFRRRHGRRMRDMARYLPLTDVGGRKDVRCGV